jgi:hypothetical protein
MMDMASYKLAGGVRCEGTVGLEFADVACDLFVEVPEGYPGRHTVIRLNEPRRPEELCGVVLIDWLQLQSFAGTYTAKAKGYSDRCIPWVNTPN